MKRLIALAFFVVLAGCTTTSVRQTTAIATPPAGARVLIVQPDVQLAMLLASGAQETRAEWSAQGRDNLNRDIQATLSGRSHPIVALDPATAQTGRVGQIMRLNEAVGASILAFDYLGVPLPTHRDGFNWTVGDGAQAIRDAYNADYALFTTARGTYSSGGRMAMFILAAAAGVAIPMGEQAVFSSLVDLRTGQVIWFNVARAGPGADMRQAEGSRSLVTSLLQGAPL